MTTQRHIGPVMQAVVNYVRANPGGTKIDAARATWGDRKGLSNYGYRPVDRAIKRGLVRAERQSSGRYQLFVADELGAGGTA